MYIVIARFWYMIPAATLLGLLDFTRAARV